MSLALITDKVSPDEPCWWLVEVITTPLAMQRRYSTYQPVTMKGRRRFQVVTVNRGDRLARHITDMGDAKLYDCGGLNIPGLWENSVAELREIAEQWRSDQRWEKEIIAEAQGESKLIDTWLMQEENKRKLLIGQSVFGPGITVQRSK